MWEEVQSRSGHFYAPSGSFGKWKKGRKGEWERGGVGEDGQPATRKPTRSPPRTFAPPFGTSLPSVTPPLTDSFIAMSTRSIGLSESLHQYLLDASLRETDVMKRLRAETAKHPESDMQIAPEQGQFMQLLVRLMSAQKTLEIGVFTGYSALAVAQALPADGRIVACDVSEEYTKVARRYWKEAGVADKIDLRIAPAVDTLDALLADGQAGTFDFAFIDADKRQYDAYYERSLKLLQTGGLIVLDNMLRSGRVVDPDPDDTSTQAICRLNEKLHDDERIHLSLIPVADGLTLAMKQ